MQIYLPPPPLPCWLCFFLEAGACHCIAHGEGNGLGPGPWPGYRQVQVGGKAIFKI